jgi:rod shape-determining protein MreC
VRTLPLNSRRLALPIALTLAILLAVLPARWTDPLRSAAAGVLRPGQVAALATRQCARCAAVRVKSHFESAQRLAEAEEQLEQLRRENRQLQGELLATQNQPPRTKDGDDAADRLLRIQCVPASVLGRQARAFLVRHQLVDVGSRSDIEPGDFVVARPALIDHGSETQLAPGQLVLSGRCIWGKIARTATISSSVCGITEPGYRDLVYLVPADGKPEGPQRFAQGVLEGPGEPACRIRLVEATQPVSVGDLVYTAAGKGLLPVPLLYGRIVRVQRPAGATHWEIWMQPAVDADEPEHVAGLSTELNRGAMSRR